MRVRLDIDFDGGSWPGPLAGSRAVAGHSWLGPNGFLNLMETAAGTGGPIDPASARAAGLAKALRSTNGFWDRSLEADELGTARRLLHWRDLLRVHGWAGQKAAGRISELALIDSACGRGVADRLSALLTALPSGGQVIDTLELHLAREEWPLLWRRLFDALEQSGTRISVHDVEEAQASGDLAAARSPGFSPKGDGSLQLLRASGPMQAAEEVAEWIAHLPSREGVVVIGGDTLLDAALRRHGLPTLGAAQAPEDNTLLQLLPLTLALGWWPADPERALELLTIARSPVPRGLARELVHALHAWPAVGSEAWRSALDGYFSKLAEEEKPERIERLRTRVESLLSSPISSQHYPAGELLARVKTLQAWLHACVEGAEEDVSAFRAASAQCSSLQRLVIESGAKDLSAAQLRRFVEEATRDAGGTQLYPAEAGLGSVAEPGGIAGSARTIVWWPFHRDSAPAAARHGFTTIELESLSSMGIHLPSADLVARAQAERWGRPLRACTESLLLVCPQHGIDGTELHPHPLWDELQARGTGLALLERRVPLHRAPPPREQKPFLPQIAAQPVWLVPAKAIQRRELESPTSAAMLIACSLQWVLQYAAKLRGGDSAALPEGAQLLGSTAHAILERLLNAGLPSDEKQAEAEALRLFDEEGPTLAARLFLPGASAEKAAARNVTGSAARRLAQTLRAGGWQVSQVETPVRGEAFGTQLEGKPDLVVARGEGRKREELVIDFKWDGLKYKLQDLERGTAYQLAAYASLLKGKKAKAPATAFFILRQQRLLSVEQVSPGIEPLAGPSADETWTAFADTHEEAWATLQSGELRASAVPAGEEDTVPEENQLVDGKLVLKPPCHYCEFVGVCGAQNEVQR